MKKLLGAALFVFGALLDRAGKWCSRKALRLYGFTMPAVPPPPVAVSQVQDMSGCLNCGSMFAVRAEFEAHKCPNRS